jgi:hypothetical protein
MNSLNNFKMIGINPTKNILEMTTKKGPPTDAPPFKYYEKNWQL